MMRKLLLACLLVAMLNVKIAATCECSYTTVKNSCRIISAAPPGFACKCIVSPRSCKGMVVPCLVNTTCDCMEPDTGYGSCLNGGGNCDGYAVARYTTADEIFSTLEVFLALLG